MGTQVPSGSAGANKLQNAALFTEATQAPTLCNLLTGSAPQEVKGKKGRKQTEPGAPIVRITDLSKEAGDEVTVDIFHELTGTPTMGDRKLEGRGESMTQAHDKVTIDQGRKLVDAGGRMAQKRTKHNLRANAKKLLGSYYGRLKEEIMQVHLMGARGDFAHAKTILPLATHEEFDEFLVNTIRPPTHGRHFYGGDASAIDNIDAADLFTLETLDMLRLTMDEAGNPIAPIMLESDEQRLHNPMWLYYATPRQFDDLKTSATGKDWNTMVSNALSRQKGFNSPLFQGDIAMWNGILVKKLKTPTRFNTGSDVTVSQNVASATTETRQPGVVVERGMLLGAQALAHAMGIAGDSNDGAGHFNVKEFPADHGNSHESVLHWMDGMSKIRFKDGDGWLYDHGVAVVDSAVSGL